MSLTVVIPRSAEPTVIQLTQENLQRELETVNGSEILVVDTWGEGIAKCRTEFICLVEPDCLVNSGYFSSMIGLFKKNPYYRQLGIMGASTGIDNWANKVYGYSFVREWSEESPEGIKTLLTDIRANKEKKSDAPYRAQMVFVPGAVIRMSMLKRVLKDFPFESYMQDLVYFSTRMSMEFWYQNGHVSLNPNSTYVTTETYVDLTESITFEVETDTLTKFAKEGVS